MTEPSDCGPCPASCGDNSCNGDEDAHTCALDCPAIEGDGYCTHDESAATSPGDCPAVAGDGLCTHGEDAATTPQDCPAVSSDGFCTHDETCTTEPADCGECLPCQIANDQFTDSCDSWQPCIHNNGEYGPLVGQATRSFDLAGYDLTGVYIQLHASASDGWDVSSRVQDYFRVIVNGDQILETSDIPFGQTIELTVPLTDSSLNLTVECEVTDPTKEFCTVDNVVITAIGETCSP